MRRSFLVAVLVLACCAVGAHAQMGRPIVGGLPQPVGAQLGAVGALAAQQPALIPQQQLGAIGMGQPMQFGGVQQQQPFVQQQPIQFGSGLPLGGAAVLPQNFQQPIAGQLNQPVLSPQQAAQLIPMDQMQAALNARVAASGQLGVMPPAQGIGMGAVGIQQQQPMAMQFGGFQQPQQQQPMQFGGVQMQQPVGIGMAQGQIPYPAAANVGAFPQMQMGVAQPMANVGFQQQPFAGVGIQQPFMQQPNINMGQMQMPQMGF